MSVPSWLRSLWSRAPSARRPRRSARPRLESLEERCVPATFAVTSTADSGAGSLRQAILSSNATPGPNLITFNISNLTGQVQFIVLNSALPTLTQTVTLDGTTEPGFHGSPLVHLEGFGRTGAVNGLTLAAPGSAVKGLAVERFVGDGIVLQSGGNTVSGTYALNNGYAGLVINNSASNLIGGGLSDVFSGNGAFGLVVFGPGAKGNGVVGNFIGTDPSGTQASANGLAGVDVQGGASGNGFSFNVVSGNGSFGFILADPGTNSNFLANDYIGVNVSGAAALANGYAGVGVGGGASLNSIGGNTSSAGNVISGNGAYGVYMLGAGTLNNVVQNSKVGTNFLGTTAVANGFAGVDLQDGAAGNGVVSDLISGNGEFGVLLSGAFTANNHVFFDLVGLAADGATGLGNAIGVFIGSGAAGNTLFGDVLGDNQNEIQISGAGTTGNVVGGCLIGTNQTATATEPTVNGVLIFGGASGNTVGGAAAGFNNVIATGIGQGFLIQDAGTNNNAVLYNFIGVNASGASLGNGTGVLVLNGPSGTMVFGNVISDNMLGIGLSLGVTGSLVQGNLIGTTIAGTAAQANQDGLNIVGNNNTVGGIAPATRNVISGNTRFGVLIEGNNNVVEGNLIGTRIDGAGALGNGSHGVFVTSFGNSMASNNTVGGTVGGAGNVIAFNGGDGVLIGSDPNTIFGIAAGTGNSVLGNSIFGNSKLGIDLGPADGVTANDSAGISGPNNFQPFPVLTSARSVNGLTLIQGTLTSLLIGSTFRIELFANPGPDASGHGQGKTFLGFVTVFIQIGPTGFAAFLEVPTTPGQAISATATDVNGDTSEFSADITVS